LAGKATNHYFCIGQISEMYVADVGANDVPPQIGAIRLDSVTVEVICPNDFVASSLKSEVHPSSAGK
jgi:hypothetical protein